MHADPELLALLALGEGAAVTEDVRDHVLQCSVCAAELDELQQVVSLGRGAEPGPLSAPSPAVWVRIRDELGLDASLEPPGPETPAETSTTGDTEGVGWTAPTPAAEPTVYARLVPTESFAPDASGRAEVATDERGRRVLQLAVQGELPRTGLRQAWLVHRDVPSRRQTLGILDGVHGVWTVDHSIDLEAYAILEISQQELGENEHSGRALLRGELARTA